MTTKSGKSVCLQAITMIDPATGWIEMQAVPTAHADSAVLAWLFRYPLPSKVISGMGNEFLTKIQDMIADNCVIKVKPITFANPQINSTLKKIHQLQDAYMVLDDDNP